MLFTQLGNLTHGTGTVAVDSAAAYFNVLTLQTHGRPCKVRIGVGVNDPAAGDTMANIRICTSPTAGSTPIGEREGADFLSSDALLRNVSIVDADGAKITNFPVAAIPEGGAIQFEWWGLDGELVVDIKGTLLAMIDLNILNRE